MRAFVSRDESSVRRITGYNPEIEEFQTCIEAPVLLIAENDEEHLEILKFVKKHVLEAHETPIDGQTSKLAKIKKTIDDFDDDAKDDFITSFDVISDIMEIVEEPP